jgi:hypothetical protein
MPGACRGNRSTSRSGRSRATLGPGYRGLLAASSSLLRATPQSCGLLLEAGPAGLPG